MISTSRFRAWRLLAILVTPMPWMGVGCARTQAEQAATPPGRPVEGRLEPFLGDDEHPCPPMGWNSYTGYSIAVTEEELLKQIGELSVDRSPGSSRSESCRSIAAPTGNRWTSVTWSMRPASA